MIGATWALPPSVPIPSAGFIVVTATCQTPGAIAAAPHTVTQIGNPQRGWQSVDNATSASLGAPVEQDPALKQRQADSVALPSLSILEGMEGAVKALTGVTEAIVYENDTETTNSLGLPAHSVSVVVKGGVDAAVADKGPGAATYGNTAVVVTDLSGLPKTIYLMRPVDVPISVVVNIHALTGYNSTFGDALKSAVVDYVNALLTGTPVYIARLYLPAQLYGDAASGAATYELTSVLAAIQPGTPGSSDLAMLFYQNATLALADVTLNVT